MESGRHQDDPARRTRLRWRSRRGLLENDLILTRFLDLHEATLSDDEVDAELKHLGLPFTRVTQNNEKVQDDRRSL
jgi:succinate dehydrogenase flavin-adding protein (antitoxin of CptAB toxin-antitoxin module)